MLATPWPLLAADGTPDEAVADIARVLGPVHRLAWLGDTPGAERTRARQHLRAALERAFMGEGSARRVAVIANWWSAAALDEDVLGIAWQIEDMVSDSLGPALRGVLDRRSDEPALMAMWRPVRFAAARAELMELTQRQPNLRSSPAPELFQEAREDAQALLRAAETPGTPPPNGLRILNLEPEEWASERRNTRQLLRGVKVWNSLVEWLRRFQAAAQALVGAWTQAATAPSPLPRDWEAQAAALDPSRPGLGLALLHDLRLDPGAPTPNLLTPAYGYRGLALVPASASLHQRAGLLFLADELHYTVPELVLPPWARNTTTELAQMAVDVEVLTERVRARLGTKDDPKLAEVLEQLAEAAGQLEQQRTRDAEEWVSLARVSLDEAVADADLAAIEAHAADRWARLKRAGRLDTELASPPMADVDDPDGIKAVADRLDEVWTEAVAELSGRIEPLTEALQGVHGDRDRTLASEAIESASLAIRSKNLLLAERALGQAATVIDAARHALMHRLDPGLQQFLGRAARSPLNKGEQHSLEVVLTRLRDRADIGLDTAPTRAALGKLIDAMEKTRGDQLPFLAVGAGDGTLLPVCWWDTAVLVDPSRFEVERPLHPDAIEGALYHLSRIHADATVEPVERDRDRFVEVVASAGPIGAPPPVPKRLIGTGSRFYAGSDEELHGPWMERDGAAVAEDPRGLLATMSWGDATDLFGTITLPATPPRVLVVDGPDLEQLLAEGGSLVDRQGPEAAARWLEALLEGMPDADPAALALAIDRLHDLDLPDDVFAHRLTRLRPVLRASTHLQAARTAAVEDFLAGPDGDAAIRDAARELARERDDLIDAAARTERSRLEDAITGLGAERDAARARLRRLQEEVTATEELANDARFRVMARWGLNDASPSRPTHTPPQRRSRPPPEPFAPVSDLGALADRLTIELGGDRDEVANLLLTLATGWWTLLAGPPGVGKSTRLRRFLRQLGHGSDTGRYLELVVRRDWHDDAALFGFWHPQQNQWAPSSEGLVEHLIAAHRDHARGALHPVVLEELNLASPEYFLARPISALEDDEPRIRLYGPELAPQNAERYPAEIAVHANTRFIGTVNVDDTVERLSPRFLSRASVLWMAPTVDELLDATLATLPAATPVSWADVLRLSHTPAPADLAPLTAVVRFLHEHRVPGAPNPRTLGAIRRYLAAATGVIDPVIAQDFQLVQRVVPGLRGVGARYRELFDQLGGLLNAGGFTRAARRVADVRRHGEEMGDYYDAFHG